MINMELKDTVDMMLSSDYKERFKAEYYQLKIRYYKLKNMYDNWDNLNFTPTCTKRTSKAQLQAMHSYLLILIARAAVENIDIEGLGDEENVN